MGFLRLWLALCVVSTHSGPVWGYRFMRGIDAVAVFFVLAGFFAAFMMDTRYKGRYRAFYLNRLLRVWPLYLLVVFISAGLVWLAFSRQILLGPGKAAVYFDHRPGLGWLGTWGLSQLFLVGQDLGNFIHVRPNTSLALGCGVAGAVPLNYLALLPQAWSLALEEYFYLLAPWMNRLGLKSSGALLALWMLAFRPLEGQCESLPMHFFPSVLGLFSGGIFSYRCYQRWQAQPLRFQSLRLGVSAAFFTFVATAGYWQAPTPLVALLTALALPSVFDLFKARPLDRLVGDLSYPIYLIHIPLQWMLAWIWPQAADHGAVLIGLSLVVATGLAVGVERPLRAYRQRTLTP